MIITMFIIALVAAVLIIISGLEVTVTRCVRTSSGLIVPQLLSHTFNMSCSDPTFLTHLLVNGLYFVVPGCGFGCTQFFLPNSTSVIPHF